MIKTTAAGTFSAAVVFFCVAIKIRPGRAIRKI